MGSNPAEATWISGVCKRQLIVQLRTVPTNSKLFLRGLLNMREKQILTSVIEIQKVIGDNRAFSKDN